MRATRVASLVAVTALCGAGLAGLAGCPTTATTTLYTPITGLTIDSATLVAGLGCGTDPTQVYKYAVVVSLPGYQNPPGATAVLPTSAVFDCFGNGQFANLPTFDGGDATYTLTVYAFNQATFPPALGNCDYTPADAACAGENPKTVATYASIANWTTTCTATQVPGVTEVAVCGSLARANDASLVPDVGSDGAGDGAGDGGTGDATADGSTGDATADGSAGDAGDAAANEGGAGGGDAATDGGGGGGGGDSGGSALDGGDGGTLPTDGGQSG